MRKQYDFSKAKLNRYVGKLKKQITIRLENSAYAEAPTGRQGSKSLT